MFGLHCSAKLRCARRVNSNCGVLVLHRECYRSARDHVYVRIVRHCISAVACYPWLLSQLHILKWNLIAEGRSSADAQWVTKRGPARAAEEDRASSIRTHIRYAAVRQVTDNKLQLKWDVIQTFHKRGRALNDHIPCEELKHHSCC